MFDGKLGERCWTAASFFTFERCCALAIDSDNQTLGRSESVQQPDQHNGRELSLQEPEGRSPPQRFLGTFCS